MKKIIINKEELIELYKCHTTYEIADIFGCSALPIQKRLHEYGIPVKKRKYNVNQDFFKNWSSSMAYVFGYIAADGCLRPNKNTLSIKSIDYELLEHVRNEMSSNHKINTVDAVKPESHGFVLEIYSKEVIYDLQCLGLGPRKSLTLEFPNVPDMYFWDFMRGIMDGDGHVFPHKEHSRQIACSICGSRPFLTKLVKLLHVKLGATEYALNNQGKACSFAIYGKYAYMFLKKVYQTEFYALSRKKRTAIASIENYERDHFCSTCGQSIGKAHMRQKYCTQCKVVIQRKANRNSIRKRKARSITW